MATRRNYLDYWSMAFRDSPKARLIEAVMYEWTDAQIAAALGEPKDQAPPRLKRRRMPPPPGERE